MENKKQVLLVEDEGYVIERVFSILSGFKQPSPAEFETVRAENGDSARKWLEEKSFDLVITGIYVHGMSGLEVLARAKAKNPDVCVIVTGVIDSADLGSKAVKEGAFDFVIKPAQLNKIESLIKLWLITNPKDSL
ncbi:MAG: response regulator [Elusimicrobia bacterium]|nr:response regulator [Elusimicrobiota bacterium]